LQCAGDGLICPRDGTLYCREGGIWRLLDPQRVPVLQPFIDGYKMQRAEEGWGVRQQPDYYLSLPHQDITGRYPDLWRLRARHMGQLMRLLEPVFHNAKDENPLVLDAGAGMAWLSYRLAERGARPIALDVNDDPADGLGVTELYQNHAGAEIVAVQGELERLPLADGACDAVVINGSLHYAGNTGAALREAWRVLRPGGRLIVMDSPVYTRRKGGEEMRAEWRREYLRRKGHAPAPLPGRGYLTIPEMRRNIATLQPRPAGVQFIPQYTGPRALLRTLKLAARSLRTRRRELATHPMWVVVGSR
jgi:SAM-dependent methyltransferase